MAASVPVWRRQLAAEPAKLAVTALAVAAAVALVLLLVGLRRGIAEQVTLYVDRQPPVLVGQSGTRNFLSQTSVLPASSERAVARVPGVAAVTPVDQQYAMLRLHDERVLSVLIGYDPGRGGGPWKLARGRAPAARGELVLDGVLAADHGLHVGSTVDYRGTRLRVVGLSAGTAAFMTPLAFVTRPTTEAMSGRTGFVNFLFVRPHPGVDADALARRIGASVPGTAALTRAEVRANDRQAFVSGFAAPLLAMVAIAVAVAVLVVAMSVYTSTTERQREYATLKALGLRSPRLVALAVEQATAVSAAGAALGVGLAFAAAAVVRSLAPRYLLAVSPSAVAAMGLASVAIALLAATLPARYLARLDPATALRR